MCVLTGDAREIGRIGTNHGGFGDRGSIYRMYQYDTPPCSHSHPHVHSHQHQHRHHDSTISNRVETPSQSDANTNTVSPLSFKSVDEKTLHLLNFSSTSTHRPPQSKTALHSPSSALLQILLQRALSPIKHHIQMNVTCSRSVIFHTTVQIHTHNTKFVIAKRKSFV